MKLDQKDKLNKLKRTLTSIPFAYKVTCVLVVAILVGMLLLGKGALKTDAPLVKRETGESQTAVTFTTSIPQAKISKQKESKAGFNPSVGSFIKTKEDDVAADPDALETLYTATDTEVETKWSAPYGRLLACETVLTIDSLNTLTPIVGIVTEDLYYAGVCIVPAGTEIHGSSQGTVSRDRILTDTQWTLVWGTQDAHNGQQLMLKGIALDRDKNELEKTWSLLDGAAGIRGTLLQSDELAETKLFGATFLGAMVAAIQQPSATVNTVGALETTKPSKVKTSVKTATAQGMSAVIERYAERMIETLEKEAFFVRVPAGKQFYLYIQQPIDLNQIQSIQGNTHL